VCSPEHKDSTIEALTQERDETEAELHDTLDILDKAEHKLLAQAEAITRLQALLGPKQPTIAYTAKHRKLQGLQRK